MIYFYIMDASRPRAPERAPLPPLESARHPEADSERLASDVERAIEAPSSPVERSAPAPIHAPAVTAPAAAAIDPALQRIEDALSDGLADVYKTLPPSIKPAFKKKGEEVARTIQLWIQEAKLSAHKVLRLIREWLGMIPRANPYYLEQQSKIKTDQVMRIAESKHELSQ